jgi:hypothetical protein
MYGSGHLYTLASDIPAIQILPATDGQVGLSPVSKLPQGTEIAPCGKGFDRHTMKVSCHGHYYYVFLRDLEEREPIVNGLN